MVYPAGSLWGLSPPLPRGERQESPPPRRGSNCLDVSRRIGDPRPLMTKHGVQDREQFMHAGDEGDFLGFTFGDQPGVEGPNRGVVTNASQGSHVQDRSY